MSDRRKALDNLEWRKCVAEQIPTFADEFKNVRTDRERLELCWNMLRSDDSLCHVVKKLNGEIQKLFDSYSTEVENSLKLNGTSYEEKKYVLPSLAKGSHPKISNGSSLIQLNCSKTQGRYLEAEEQIKAGDVLILEAPYAAVLVRENQTTHCSRCFKLLEETNLPCHSCHVKYCSLFCQGKAWEEYHRDECCLSPLLQMLDISSHLALRLLLVTGAERLLKFLQEEKKLKPQVGKDLSVKDRIPGCTSDGLYPGDYKCVYSLVTNTDLQPNEALVSYAMDSALITEVAFNYIYGHQKLMPTSDALDNRHLDNDPCLINDGITKETMGCLLLHHMQQMPCNIHAVTAVVSVDQHPGSGVSSKEQRRIAAGIYPTASLLNHACDPDVIVSFLGSTLVVRATHNIKPGEEIAHCYGPSASRMTRQVRQSLLKKQYFFTCYCSACKSDKDLEEQQVYGATFSCQKCSSCVVVSRENNKIVGKCQNDKCRMVKDFSSEVEAVKQAQELFSRAVAFLEEGHYHKSALVLKECLKKRQLVLQKYDKDVAQTHDLLARCYATLKDFRQASFHCEQSTESVRRRFGSESVEYAHELHKFSLLLFNGRQVNKARSVIDSAIRLLSIHYGGKYSDVEELQEMKKTLESF